MRLLSLCLTLALLPMSAYADEHWSDYRGPNRDGHSAARDLPLQWSDTQHVKWKTAIHGKGWSSPIIWDKQVWLTTASEDGRKMSAVCVDRETGKILLDQLLFENANPEPVHDINSYASPSPVIEAGRVYVHFGNYGTACLDTRTFKTLWRRRDLSAEFSVGPGSSPMLHENLLILTMDGIDMQYMIGLDKTTGRTVWKTPRSADLSNVPAEGRKSFNTPVLATAGGQAQVICPGANAAYAYAPATGKELWRVRFNGYSHSSRPLIGKGVVYINTGYDRASLVAVRLGGSGDITDSHVLWRYTRNVPNKPSSLLIDDLIYLVNDSGMVTCLEAKTGTEVWKERLNGSYSASPLYAEGRIYLFSERGTVTVLKPGRTLEVLAENQMPSGFMASPAVVGKAFYLRTKTHLYRIEK